MTNKRRVELTEQLEDLLIGSSPWLAECLGAGSGSVSQLTRSKRVLNAAINPATGTLDICLGDMRCEDLTYLYDGLVASDNAGRNPALWNRLISLSGVARKGVLAKDQT